METGDESQAEFSVSDHGQIRSLYERLNSVPGVRVHRMAARPDALELGTVDVLTVLAGSGGLIAAIRVIPEFLRSRRSDISVTVTVKGKQVTVTASNVKEVIPILEHAIDDK